VTAPRIVPPTEAQEPQRLRLAPADPNKAAPLPFDLVLMGAGVNVGVRSLFRSLFGWKRYPGSVEAICSSVIADCWTGEFFAGSAGHFKQFWTRDLAISTPGLIALGHRDRVIRSWSWALERFERAGRITTTIFNRRFPRDVYAYACDSLPLLLYGIKMAGAEHLIARHRSLLETEIARYHRTVFDPELEMARTDGYFSGPRDCMTGRSTVFANVCLALLSRLLDEHPALTNPLRGADVAGAMHKQLWMGDHFRDSLCRDLPSGDGNVWPFFFDVFTDEDMQRRAFATLEARGFTQPLPLRYFERRLPESELPVPRFFTPNYQGDPSWAQLGPAYLQLLRKIDRPLMERHRDTMARFIERDGNYLEVYAADGTPYRGRWPIYYCDEGMIWAAMFLSLYN
jgi:hypothetical protein